LCNEPVEAYLGQDLIRGYTRLIKMVRFHGFLVISHARLVVGNRDCGRVIERGTGYPDGSALMTLSAGAFCVDTGEERTVLGC
jgi:hypothetical protein